MKLVRKVSRKKYFRGRIYEYERLLIPIPSYSHDIVRPWLNRELKIFVEPVTEGFAVLVCEGDKRIEGWPLSVKFRKAVRELYPKKPAQPITQRS